MTDKELLKECKNFIDNYAMWEERDYDGFNLADKIEKQLTIPVSCEQLKDKEVLSFPEWKMIKFKYTNELYQDLENPRCFYTQNQLLKKYNKDFYNL